MGPVLVLLLASLAAVCANVDTHRYTAGEPVGLWANKVWASSHGVCAPPVCARVSTVALLARAT